MMSPQQYAVHHQHRPPPRVSHPSEEEEEDHSGRSSGGTSTATKRKELASVSDLSGGVPPPSAATTNDVPTMQLARKPRGRPPGSRNKPRPPIVVSPEADNSAMRPHVLEISSGCDVVEVVARFSRRRQLGLFVLSGSDSVTNVTLRQPNIPGAAITFHGRFDILSLSAAYLLPSESSAMISTLANACGFTISLAGAQGQVVGGSVVGPLFAASTVVVLVASFPSPSFHRLPVEDEITSESLPQPAPPISSMASDSCALPAYSVDPISMSCQIPSNAIWTPPVRRPPY